MHAAPDQDGASWQSTLRSFARRTLAGTQEESLTTPLASAAPHAPPDEEMGEEPRWAIWAREAAGRVRQQASEAAEHTQRGLSQGIEKAQSIEWGEQVKGMHSSVSRGLERVQSSATSATTSFSESVSQGMERAKTVEWGEQAKRLQVGVTRSFESVAETASGATSSFKENLSNSQVVQKVKENAAVATGAARGALSTASERVSGVATLAMNPKKLGQFIGIFLTGVVLLIISFNFLPTLLIKPQLFAMFFTLGSMTTLGSFVVLSSPWAFANTMVQRHKLPFSGAYVVGLVGTLWATLIQRSYLFTAVFTIVQAVALLYFLFSYLPGGTAFLDMVGRFGRRSVRSLVVS